MWEMSSVRAAVWVTLAGAAEPRAGVLGSSLSKKLVWAKMGVPMLDVKLMSSS